MQEEEDMAIIDSVSEAIKKGNAADALQAYTKCIKKGIVMKFAHLGENPLSEEYQSRQTHADKPPEHAIVKRTVFTVKKTNH